MTQPRLYAAVAQHPGTRSLYAERLSSAGVVGAIESEEMIQQYKEVLESGGSVLQSAEFGQLQQAEGTSVHTSGSRFSKFSHGRWSDYTRTALPVASSNGTQTHSEVRTRD